MFAPQTRISGEFLIQIRVSKSVIVKFHWQIA